MLLVWADTLNYHHLIQCVPMNIIKQCLFLAFLLLFSGCTSQYVSSVSRETFQKAGLLDQHELTRDQNWVLHASSKIFLAPVSYSTNSEGSPDNGMNLKPMAVDTFDESLRNALRLRFPLVSAGEGPMNLPQALTAANEDGAQFVIYSDMSGIDEDWKSLKERAGEAEPKPQKRYARNGAHIRIVVLDAYSGQVLDVVEIASKAKFFYKKGDPADFYQMAASAFVNRISNVP